MSGIINTVKSKLSGNNKSTDSSSKSQEPTFSILPHPAKTNDPADLQPSGGLRNSGGMDAFHARDPYVPSEQIKNSMPAPLSHEELQARQASLKQDHYKP